MSLHWFWNCIFSLLASGTFTASMLSVTRARLCPFRLRRDIKAQKNLKELRSTVEAAFGTSPDLPDPNDAWVAGFLAYLPLVIAAHVFLGLFIHSGVWRVLTALVVAIPLAVLTGKVINWIAGQKTMLERAKKLIKDHDPNAWREMTNAWVEQRIIEARDRARAQAYVRAQAQVQAAAGRGGWKYWGEAQMLPCPFCGKKMERSRLQAMFGGIDDFFAAASSYDTSKGGKHIEQKCDSCGQVFESRLAPDAEAVRQGASFHQWRKKMSINTRNAEPADEPAGAW